MQWLLIFYILICNMKFIVYGWLFLHDELENVKQQSKIIFDDGH